MLVTLVETTEDCLKKLFKTVRTTRRISELVRQRVSDRRTSDRKRPTAVWMCWVDSLRWAGVGLQNVDGAEKRRKRMWWDGRRGNEVPNREDSGTPWHPSCNWPSLAHPPNEVIVDEWRQTAIKLPCVTDHTGGSIEHSLQLVGNRLRRPCIDCVAIVDVRRHKSVHERCRWSIIQRLSDTTKLTKPVEGGCTVHTSWRHDFRDSGRTRLWQRVSVHDRWQSQYLSRAARPENSYPRTKRCALSQPRAVDFAEEHVAICWPIPYDDFNVRSKTLLWSLGKQCEILWCFLLGLL